MKGDPSDRSDDGTYREEYEYRCEHSRGDNEETTCSNEDHANGTQSQKNESDVKSNGSADGNRKGKKQKKNKYDKEKGSKRKRKGHNDGDDSEDINEDKVKEDPSDENHNGTYREEYDWGNGIDESEESDDIRSMERASGNEEDNYKESDIDGHRTDDSEHESVSDLRNNKGSEDDESYGSIDRDHTEEQSQMSRDDNIHDKDGNDYQSENADRYRSDRKETEDTNNDKESNESNEFRTDTQGSNDDSDDEGGYDSSEPEGKTSSEGCESSEHNGKNANMTGKSKWRVTREEKRLFYVFLTKDEWNSIKPQTGAKKLKKGWTDICFDKFERQNKTCVLSFRRQYIRKRNSQKGGTPYWKADAKCKFSNCCHYSFHITKEPIKKTDAIRIKVTRRGEIKHSVNETHKRHVIGKTRERLAKKLDQEGIANWYYAKMSGTHPGSQAAGNIQRPKNMNVLHKVSSEWKQNLNLSTDVLQEVKMLQDVLAELDDGKILPGFIQTFACRPFKITLFTQDQLLLYHALPNRVLYLDATGSIIQKIPENKKPVYYYALVVESPVAGRAAVPVAEMISNDHHASEITHFISKFVDGLNQIFSSARAKLPRRVEIDNSWAMLNGVLNGFNKEDSRSYLNKCWDVVANKKKPPKKTYPHMCSAHMMNQVSQMLRRLQVVKQTRRFGMHAFGLLVETSCMTEATAIFRHMCRVFDAKASSERVQVSEDELRNWSTVINSVIDQDDAEDMAPPSRQKDPITIKESSPFYQHFKSVYIEEQITFKENLSDDSVLNSKYTPGFIDGLLNNLMPIFPLWSALLLGDLSRHAMQERAQDRLHETNNLVENHFEKVKKDCLKTRGTRLRPGHFIRSRLQTIKGQLNEIRIYRPNLIQTSPKKKQKDGNQEKWGKKKKKGKPTYFDRSKKGKMYGEGTETDGKKQTKKESKPKKMDEGKQNESAQGMPEEDDKSTPKKQTNTNEGPSQGNHYQGVPRWGGNGVLDCVRVFLGNTCTLDNLMLIFFKLAVNRPDILAVISQEDFPICQYVSNLKRMGEEGRWTEAKIEWLTTFCDMNINDQDRNAGFVNWNLYGSEYNVVTRHLHDIQSSTQTSTCSDRDCPRRQTTPRSNDISLSARLPGCDVQTMMDDFMNQSFTRCGVRVQNSNDKNVRCKGIRTWERRQFNNFGGKPPFLVFSPTYCGANAKLVTAKFSPEINVGVLRYELFAVTVNRNEHFTSAFKLETGWYWYDGLVGSLKGPRKSLEIGKKIPEHLVYVRIE